MVLFQLSKALYPDPSFAPSPCTSTDPFCSIACLLLLFWWREEKGQQMENRGAVLPVPGAEIQCNTALVLFPSYMGEFRILSHSRSTKLPHCPKKPCKNLKAFFCTKLMRSLPTKFTSSRTKFVQLKWELQLQRQAKKGHSMSSWDCLLCNCALHVFKTFA